MIWLSMYLLGVLLWPQWMTYVSGSTAWRDDAGQGALQSIAWPAMLMIIVCVSAFEAVRPAPELVVENPPPEFDDD